ncbi:MAG: HD domain-containing protein [Candidatus Midichloria mitochondrii]|nr:HD domain-containing protein [Candidatus Midichloria mitochondrii]MDJ1288447.1 HD domain-containing protein [Candidatus Midichloria mitochondrii]
MLTPPLEVACIAADYLFRTDIMIVTILHDCIEDTELTKEIIAKEFGNKIAGYVADLTRIKHDRKISSAEMVKLCDRLHNMRTIAAKSTDKIQKTTLETLPWILFYSLLLV